MYSATTPITSDRAVAQASSQARTLHWWARPHAFTILFLIPLFIVCTLLPDRVFLTWKHAQNFVTPEAFAAGLCALCGFAFAAQLAWLAGVRRAPSYGFGASHLIARAQYRAVVYCILCITLGAYVLLLGPAIRNPSLAAALYTGGIPPSEMRQRLDAIPGISSFVNLGPLYVTLLMLQSTLTGSRLTHFDRVSFVLFLFLVMARVFLWSERLALLEILIPIAIIRIAPMSRYRTLVAMLPFLGVLGLGVFFGATEYFRSWTHAYSGSGISFTDFVLTRFLGYYAAAINNGALIFTTFDPLFIPYGTARWFFKFPLLSAPDSNATSFYGRIDMLFWTVTNPELTNTSGIFSPLNDFGVLGGVVVWVLLGAITGRLLRGFSDQRLMSMLLFPSWMTGVYELPRIFYWGDPRYFPALLLAPVIFWVLSRSAIRFRLQRHREWQD